MPASDTCKCCGKTGHVKKDCKFKDKECTVCGKVGHLKALCRQTESWTEDIWCKCCGKTGHEKKDCKFKDKECTVCWKVGHLKAMCRQADATWAPEKPAKGGNKACACCGNANHTTKECKFKDRECGICGKTGHLQAMCKKAGSAWDASWDWETPAKGGDKPCTVCGKTNHVKKDCKFKDKECTICGKIGHLKAVCKQAEGGAAKGAGKKTIDPKACKCCGKTGHEKKDCKFIDKECSVCGKTGHIKAVCKQAEGSPAKGAGKGKKTTEKTYKEKKTPETDEEKASRRRCFNCGQLGHGVAECTEGKLCNCCGSKDHERRDCPNVKDKCETCGKTGHIAAICRTNEKK